MRRSVPLLFMAALSVLTVSAFPQKKQYASLEEALAAGRWLRGDPGPSDVRWIEAGDAYSFTRYNGSGREIWRYRVEDSAEDLLFSEAGHTFPGSDRPFSYRDLQWTRDYGHLLFQTNFRPVWRYSGNADYYLYSLKDRSLIPVVQDAFTAEVSPDGTMVGYGKEGDLFVFRMGGQSHTRLTHDGSEKFYNGRFGWANEEEFGLVQAWEWSPDSRHIAFWQTDEREVPVYRLTDFSGQHPDYLEIPYPKVGDPPPAERLGVIDVTTGDKKWLDLDPAGGYIPRIYWTTRPGTLAVVWMNRTQDHLKLYFIDVINGGKKLVMEERSDTWIDIFDFFAGELHLFYFPENMHSFFWISDRSGFSHIYHYDYSGSLISQVTRGDFDVIGIKAIDPAGKKLWYLSTEVSPLERHLFSTGFNGKGKRQITTDDGNHSVDVSPGGKYFIDRWSTTDTPPQTVLRDGRGRTVNLLAGHDRSSAHLEEYAYAPRVLFSFMTSDGRQIDGYYILPVDFDPAKTYPLLMDVYGGPGSQGVFNAFGTSGWHQYLSQRGFVVANINNRGNGGYGRDFEKVVHLQLGKWETRDFAEAAGYLSSMPWIDADRTGIMGHSFGGFSAGMSLLTHPGVFETGIVTAAISDHVNYDCILTERYMGLIGENREGYRESSLITHAGKLEGQMMLVHSLMDDNVHPQNTFQLATALIDAGKSFELKIYPPGAHGVAYDMNSRFLLYREYLDFLEKQLLPGR